MLRLKITPREESEIGDPDNEHNEGAKEGQVLVEKDGKFDLVSLKDVESQGLLPPLPVSHSGNQRASSRQSDSGLHLCKSPVSSPRQNSTSSFPPWHWVCIHAQTSTKAPKQAQLGQAIPKGSMGSGQRAQGPVCKWSSFTCHFHSATTAERITWQTSAAEREASKRGWAEEKRGRGIEASGEWVSLPIVVYAEERAAAGGKKRSESPGNGKDELQEGLWWPSRGL